MSVSQSGVGIIEKSTAKGGMKSAGSIAGNAGMTLAGSILGAGLTMINEVFAAHFLGTEAYGSYGLALMLAKVGELIALFGVPLSVLHFLPVHLNLSQSRLALGVIVGSMILPLITGGVFVLTAGLWHTWIATHIFNLPLSAGYIAVLACAIPLTSLCEIFGSVARGFGRFLPFIVIRNLVPPLCYMPVLIYLSLSGGPKIGTAYGYTVAAGLGALAGGVWIWSLVRSRVGFVRPALKLRALYKFSAPIAMNSMVSIVFLWVDLFLLASLTDGKTVGVYRGCTQIVLTFDLILTACSVATAPIYAVLATEGRQQLQETLTAATRIATLLATPLLLVILVNGSDILGLLGPDFREGHLALTILAIGQFVKVVFGAASIALIICGRQSVEVFNTGAAAVLNIILNLILIPRLGLLGAAVSTAISLLALSALRTVQLWFVLGLRAGDSILLRILAVSVPIAAVVWVVSLAFGAGPGTGLFDLAVRLIAMGVLIVAGVWLFCLGKHERAALIATILRRQVGPNHALQDS